MKKRDQIQDTIARLIRAHIVPPPRIVDLITMASYDLYLGPFTTKDFEEEGAHPNTPWSGYVPATEEIERWADASLPESLWVDTDAEDVLTRDPSLYICEGTTEEQENDLDYLSEFVYELDRKEIAKIILGELIGNGVF